jgi:O-antigen ligase
MLEYCRLPTPYDTHNFNLLVATEFGIPCFLVFFVMLLSITRESVSWFRERLKKEPLISAAMLGCMAAIWFQNIFGTRFIDLGLVGPMWIGIAAICSMNRSGISKNLVFA